MGNLGATGRLRPGLWNGERTVSRGHFLRNPSHADQTNLRDTRKRTRSPGDSPGRPQLWQAPVDLLTPLPDPDSLKDSRNPLFSGQFRLMNSRRSKSLMRILLTAILLANGLSAPMAFGHAHPLAHHDHDHHHAPAPSLPATTHHHHHLENLPALTDSAFHLHTFWFGLAFPLTAPPDTISTLNPLVNTPTGLLQPPTSDPDPPDGFSPPAPGPPEFLVHIDYIHKTASFPHSPTSGVIRAHALALRR